MPSVPQIPNKPIKSLYNPKDSADKVSMKQQTYIMTLCSRRKIPLPNFDIMSKVQAANYISSLTNDDRFNKPSSLPSPLKCSKCKYIAISKSDFNDHWSLDH